MTSSDASAAAVVFAAIGSASAAGPTAAILAKECARCSLLPDAIASLS